MERGAKDRKEPSPQILMACLGDASRFRLVEVLIAGARCVTELAAEVGLSQSCTTRHLQALERRKVVVGTREGKRVMYRLRSDEPALDPLLAWALQPAPRRRRAPGAGLAPGAGDTLSPLRALDRAHATRARSRGEGAPRPPISRSAVEGPTAPDPPEAPPPEARKPGISPGHARRQEIEDYLL
jgi:ArsR family transcriptional regulator